MKHSFDSKSLLLINVGNERLFYFSLPHSLTHTLFIYLFKSQKQLFVTGEPIRTFQTDDKEKGTFSVGGVTILKGRWKIPVKDTFRSEGR